MSSPTDAVELARRAADDGITKIVVGAVITDQAGNVLLLHRIANDYLGGLWELPSGGVDTEETLDTALCREVHEERLAMRIDKRIERHVRDALGSAVNEDGDRMVESFKGLNQEDTLRALGLGLFAVGFVVNDVYRDGATDEELLGLAHQIVETEAGWVTLDENALMPLLRAAATGDNSLAEVNKDDAVFLTFVSGGHLLAAFSLDDQPWYDYLDEIWAQLQAAPDPE